MLIEGQSRVRWIRFLVVVLALTASRGNFPLFKRSEPTSFKHGLSKAVPKYQGVVPSRRYLESSRAVGSQACSVHPGLPVSPRLALLEQESSLPLAGALTGRASDLLSGSTKPKYLKFFLQAASTSSLPPPV